MGNETKNPEPTKEEPQDLNSKWVDLGFDYVKKSVDNIKSTADKIITLDTGLTSTAEVSFLASRQLAGGR